MNSGSSAIHICTNEANGTKLPTPPSSLQNAQPMWTAKIYIFGAGRGHAQRATLSDTK